MRKVLKAGGCVSSSKAAGGSSSSNASMAAAAKPPGGDDEEEWATVRVRGWGERVVSKVLCGVTSALAVVPLFCQCARIAWGVSSPPLSICHIICVYPSRAPVNCSSCPDSGGWSAQQGRNSTWQQGGGRAHPNQPTVWWRPAEHHSHHAWCWGRRWWRRRPGWQQALCDSAAHVCCSPGGAPCLT